MTSDPLQAWLIHKTPTGDTSMRVRLLTRERGLLDCYYRGGRNTKKNATLQPFTPLWLLTNERHHWFYIKTLENSGLPLSLTGSSLFAALYINELIFHAVTLQEPNEQLFSAYQDTLVGLQTTTSQTDLEILLRRFENKLLTICGYSLSFTTQPNEANPINPNAFYQFIAGHGFKENTTGIPGNHILALANDNFAESGALKTAKFIMRQAIDHLLDGRPLKSRALYLSTVTIKGSNAQE